MSTSTTHRSGTRAYVGGGPAPDEPQFQVRFTPDNEPAPQPNNRFRWSGWGTLHIGVRGVLVTARRRAWIGFHRRERRFFPSADIRSVYREGGAIRVDLPDGPTGKQSFLFWPTDLRAAATIVALLPTVNTVEIDSPTGSEDPPPPRRISASVWVLTIAGTAIAALIAASVAFLRQGEASLQSTTSTGTASPPAAPARITAAASPKAYSASDPEVILADAEFGSMVPRIDGLKTQFATAFTALQMGVVSRDSFTEGLDGWLIPQWRMLGAQLANTAPPRTSVRYGPHENLAAAVAVWEDGLRDYAQGLRDGDNARNIATLNRLKRADDFEQQARHWLASVETSGPMETDAGPSRR